MLGLQLHGEGMLPRPFPALTARDAGAEPLSPVPCPGATLAGVIAPPPSLEPWEGARGEALVSLFAKGLSPPPSFHVQNQQSRQSPAILGVLYQILQHLIAGLCHAAVFPLEMWWPFGFLSSIHPSSPPPSSQNHKHFKDT